jgi:hypothetical protein
MAQTDKPTTNKPTSQQANKPTSQQANKPTNPQCARRMIVALASIGNMVQNDNKLISSRLLHAEMHTVCSVSQ